MSQVKIGGQAVIEGVMMKYKNQYAVAVRKPDKEIDVKVNTCSFVRDKIFLFNLPIIRGLFVFIESLVVGMKTLMYSASFFDEEDENNKDSKTDGKSNDKSDSLFMAGTLAFSLIIAIGLFMLLPAWISSLFENFINNHFALGLIEGVVRLLIFFIYIFFITRMEDIKRTFMYHGAEHKSINCIEAGDELTVENVMKHSRFHKRCGTSFLFVVMVVSILVFMCITAKKLWLRLLLRVLLVPVVAGISYEFIRFAGNSESFIANILSKPGLWIQQMTTFEPTPDMVEVAIKSVEAVFDWKEYLAQSKDK